MKIFSARVVYFYIFVVTVSASVSFGVIDYWYRSIINHHKERLSEVVFIRKNNIKTLYSQQQIHHDLNDEKIFQHTLNLLNDSFIDTTQYGFSNEFTISSKENGSYVYLYKNINGKPNYEKEVIGDLLEKNPIAQAYDGKKGFTTYRDIDNEKALVAYDFLDIEHRRLAILARVPYIEIAGPKIAAATSVVILSFLILISGGLVFYYLSGRNLRKLQNAYRELEIFGDIMNSANELIAYVGTDRRYIAVNDRYEELYEVPKKEIEGMHIEDFHGADRYQSHIKECLDECLVGKRTSASQWIELASGRKIFLDIHFAPHWHNNKIEGVVITTNDITELENAKQQLLDRTYQLKELTVELENKIRHETKKRIQHEQLFFEQKKFADMGQMINAIAHQWRQPINSLGLYIQYIIDSVNDKTVTGEMLEEFKKDSVNLVMHMSKTIDDFRNFFNPNTNEADFEVIKAVIETVSLVDAQLKNNFINYSVMCKCDYREFLSCNDLEHPPCKHPMSLVGGYPSEFKQVLMNIIQNAKDSLQSKDVDRELLIGVEAHEEKVLVRVQDNGGGIRPDVLNKIFDPYFTTKGEGKGTGIGLYMSKLIVEDHMGGILRAYNKDDGAVFEMVLRKVKPQPVE